MVRWYAERARRHAAAQACKSQIQVTSSIMKTNADAEKSAVLTLSGRSRRRANVGAGVGGNAR